MHRGGKGPGGKEIEAWSLDEVTYLSTVVKEKEFESLSNV